MGARAHSPTWAPQLVSHLLGKTTSWLSSFTHKLDSWCLSQLFFLQPAVVAGGGRDWNHLSKNQPSYFWLPCYYSDGSLGRVTCMLKVTAVLWTVLTFSLPTGGEEHLSFQGMEARKASLLLILCCGCSGARLYILDLRCAKPEGNFLYFSNWSLSTLKPP